jgi:hypothetical protein
LPSEVDGAHSTGAKPTNKAPSAESRGVTSPKGRHPLILRCHGVTVAALG